MADPEENGLEGEPGAENGGAPGIAPDVPQVLDEALALGDDGEWDEMATLLAEALDDSPDDPYLLCWLGVAEQELGNDGAAYEYFRRCLAEDPLDPHLLALAGAGLAAFDDPDAEAALRAAALSGPDLPITRLHYGAYLAREGHYDQAIEQLEAARDLAPDDASVRGELGAAHALKGDLETAAEHFEVALELAPDDDWTRVLLGLVSLELDRMDDAAQMLVQAAVERDDDVEANALAGLAATIIGWDDAAQQALARAEQNATPREAALVEELERAIFTGADAARPLLLETLAPTALRERLRQPI